MSRCQMAFEDDMNMLLSARRHCKGKQVGANPTTAASRSVVDSSPVIDVGTGAAGSCKAQ